MVELYTKEEIMKRIVRYGSLSVFFFLAFIQIQAKTIPEGQLFPTATGMVGKVQGTNINLRQYPDKQSKVTNHINQDQVRIIGQNKEWYQVKTPDGEGWIYKQYVKADKSELIPYTKVAGEEIVDYGLQFIGTPYVWGGSDLDSGVDCSGFTQEVYKAFDVEISRVSYMQANDGKTIDKQSLRTGDLVFFDTVGSNNGGVSHVGIYMENSKFLHSDGTHGVMVSDLNSPYYTRNYVKGIRVLDN